MNIKDILKGATSAENNGQRRSRDEIRITLMCNTDKKMYRTMLSNALYEKLGKPTEVQFAFRKDLGKAILASKLQNCKDSFKVANVDGKYPHPTVNSNSLINGFISNFGLNFSQKHSHTFNDIAFDAADGVPVAIINILRD
ncbi:MAG: hypothetical protein FWE84_04330 [Firmicutes bacterium]|nr:hypothetical protein [Bacillota bacterium]